MPLPTNTSRPSLPYVPAQSLPNNTRYGILTTTKRPPTAEMLDAEFNALTDDVNMLAASINAVQAGTIVGADDPLNANKVLKTDGANNLSWTYVTNAEIEANAVVEQKLAAQSVTTPKIGDAAVTTQKIAQNAVASNQLIDAVVTTPKIADGAVIMQKLGDNAVTTQKLSDNAVTTQKLANQSVTQGQIADSAVGTNQLIDANVTTLKIADAGVTTPKLATHAVTAAKIGSEASLANTFLAADGTGNASFIDKIGRILQIVNFEITDTVYDQTPCSPANPVSFSVPFRLTITPQKTGSKIILSYGVNISGGGNCYYGVVLCRNNLIWKIGTPNPSQFDGGVTHGGYVHSESDDHYGTPCFSNIFVDTGTIGQQIVYDLKRASQYVTLNRSAHDRQHTISTMVAVEIDI